MTALSPRQYEALTRYMRAASVKEVAAEMGISERAVGLHLAHARAKLEVDSLIAAALVLVLDSLAAIAPPTDVGIFPAAAARATLAAMTEEITTRRRAYSAAPAVAAQETRS
jgi:DNA-binding CsgD family transcriptional regulator